MERFFCSMKGILVVSGIIIRRIIIPGFIIGASRWGFISSGQDRFVKILIDQRIYGSCNVFIGIQGGDNFALLVIIPRNDLLLDQIADLRFEFRQIAFFIILHLFLQGIV